MADVNPSAGIEIEFQGKTYLIQLVVPDRPGVELVTQFRDSLASAEGGLRSGGGTISPGELGIVGPINATPVTRGPDLSLIAAGVEGMKTIRIDPVAFVDMVGAHLAQSGSHVVAVEAAEWGIMGIPEV